MELDMGIKSTMDQPYHTHNNNSHSNVMDEVR